MDEQAFRFYLGVDCGSEKHQVCLVNDLGEQVQQSTFEHSGDGLECLLGWIRATTEAEPAEVAAAIEIPHGSVVEALAERGFSVFSINPKQLDRFRDRHTVAGAKRGVSSQCGCPLVSSLKYGNCHAWKMICTKSTIAAAINSVSC